MPTNQERNFGTEVINAIVLGLLPQLEAEVHKRVTEAFVLLHDRLTQPSTPTPQA